MSDAPDELTASAEVHIVRAGAGEHILAAGVEHVFALGAELSQGRLSVETFTVPVGRVGAPPHVHAGHDECFVVLAGQLTLLGADGETTLGRSDVAYAPRGSVHGFRNAHTSLPVTALCISTPAGYEQFFRDVQSANERGEVLDAASMAALRGRYDTSTPPQQKP